MAGIKFSITTNIKELNALVKSFPALQAALFHKIGKQGALTLKGQFMSGQEINLHGGYGDKDRTGAYLISHFVTKKAKGVTFSSKTLNLFENKFNPRGIKKSPKKILTGKFKAVAENKLQSWADKAMSETMDKEFDKT